MRPAQRASCVPHSCSCNDPATPRIYALSLHDALPISDHGVLLQVVEGLMQVAGQVVDAKLAALPVGHARDVLEALDRSEEHTSELQSRGHLVCRLLLEKKKAHEKTLLALLRATATLTD